MVIMNLKNETLLQDGRYRVTGVLGQGGFGITYEGVQVSLNRKVAIKEFFMKELCERDNDSSYVSVPSTGSRDVVERFRQKFLKEARNIASFTCKGIVSVIDVFEENGTAYYVMDYLCGGSLADKVKNGPLPEPVALRYISQVAESLSYLHGRSVMHLDVKPANILLDEADNAVLIDFGLSKQYDDVGQQTSTTPVGLSHGYAPMEQYKRGGVSSFSPATDIYSLGATLYKLLTGQTPPEASDLINDGLPLFPALVSSRTRTAVETAMQPQISKRPQSIAEFLSLLDTEETVIHQPDSEDTVIEKDVTDFGVPVREAFVTPGFDDRQNREKSHKAIDDATLYDVAAPAVKKNRLPLVNAFIIVEAAFLMLHNVSAWVWSWGDFDNILWCIQLPLSLVFAIVLLCYVKGSKALWGAGLMTAFMSLRLVMNLSCYDSSLFFFDITTQEEWGIYLLIYNAVCYLLLLPAYGLLLLGSGASGKLTQAVTGSYALLSLFSFGSSLCALLYNWDMGSTIDGLSVVYSLILSIYLIIFCSMTFSEKLKNNRRSGSTVWIMIRLFTVMFLLSGCLPLFSGFGQFGILSDVVGDSLFEVMNVLDTSVWFYLPLFILLVINFVQSLVLPRKWINGVASFGAVVVIAFLFRISEEHELGAGMVLAMISSLSLFILTFIPVKK